VSAKPEQDHMFAENIAHTTYNFKSNILTLKLIVLTLVFHVYIGATLEHLGFPFGLHIASIAPILMIIIYSVFNLSRFKSIKYSTNYWLIVIAIGLLYSMLSSYNYGILDGFATFKTFFILTVFTLFLNVVMMDEKICNIFHRFFYNILLFISCYSIMEFFDRIFFHYIFETLFNYVSIVNIGGLNYLGFGGGLGIQPLGIFVDLHTHNSIILIAGLLAFTEKKYLVFFIAVFALVVSTRVTSIFIFCIGFGALVVPTGIFLLLLPMIAVVVYFIAENLNGQSWSIIKSHVLNNFSHVFDQDVLPFLFGTGYSRSDVVERVGYNEIFFIIFIFSFGIFGVFLLILLMAYIIKSMKKTRLNGLICRYDRLAIALVVSIPLSLFHYNLFFQPFVLFVYIYIVHRVLFLKKTNSKYRLIAINHGIVKKSVPV